MSALANNSPRCTERDGCLFSKCSLQHLPIELIVNILSELPAKDIAQWQCVSRHFHDVVADSVTLQYKIECCVADVLEEPFCITRDKAEQINAMREWTMAWKNVQWKMELTEASALAQAINLNHPPSIIRRSAQKTYNFDVFGRYVGYGYDADADVVVVAKLNRESKIIELLPLDLDTGERHTRWCLEAIPMVLTFEDFPSSALDHLKVDVTVHGDLVMCCVRHGMNPEANSDITEYLWCSWPSGRARMHLWSDASGEIRLDDFTFLTERYLIATVHDQYNSALAVFDAENSRSEECFVGEALSSASALLKLPCIKEDFIPSFFGIECKPQRYTLPTTYQDFLFTPAHSSTVIHVHLHFHRMRFPYREDHYFDLVIPQHTIMQHINEGDDVREATYTDSSKWCREGGLFVGGPMFKGAVCGSRYVTKEVDAESGQSVATIYDFSPLQTTLHDLEREEDVDTIEAQRYDISDVFGVFERTSRPYRRVKTKIVLEWNEFPQLTEDSIVIVSSPSLRRTRVYCF